MAATSSTNKKAPAKKAAAKKSLSKSLNFDGQSINVDTLNVPGEIADGVKAKVIDLYKKGQIDTDSTEVRLRTDKFDIEGKLIFSPISKGMHIEFRAN